MSIFARELLKILRQHQKNIGSLYTVTVEVGGKYTPIPHVQIKRLKKATEADSQQSVTLNPDQLEALELHFGLSEEEKQCLHAALVAESLSRFLLDRIEQRKALQIAEGLFFLLQNADESMFSLWRTLVIDEVRGEEELSASVSEEGRPDDDEAPLDEMFEPVAEIYEAALLCLSSAKTAQHPSLQRGYIAMSISLLIDAKKLIASLPESTQGTQQQSEWQQIITSSLQQAHLLVDQLA